MLHLSSYALTRIFSQQEEHKLNRVTENKIKRQNKKHLQQSFSFIILHAGAFSSSAMEKQRIGTQKDDIFLNKRCFSFKPMMRIGTANSR